MGTTLTGTTPQDTYDSLIKVTDNGPLSGSLKTLTDGLGNDSALALSTGAASVTGTLAVSGNATFDTNTLVVDAANNRVGIGTATPTAGMLNVVGAAAANGLTIKSAGNGGTFPLRVTWASGTDGEFLCVNDSGNVGIGTSSPSDKLHVSGSGNTATFITGSGCTTYVQSVTNETRIGNLTSGGGSIVFSPADAERVRITSNGLTFNGDTAAANALDDYEEGTFTPSIAFGGASVGVTYSEQAGKYTKIGRQVTVEFEVVLTSKGSSTGRVEIGNLPFTGIASQFTGAVELRNVTFTQKYAITEIGRAAGTFFRVILMDSASNSAELTNTGVANDSAFFFSATYFV